jgi:integrase
MPKPPEPCCLFRRSRGCSRFPEKRYTGRSEKACSPNLSNKEAVLISLMRMLTPISENSNGCINEYHYLPSYQTRPLALLAALRYTVSGEKEKAKSLRVRDKRAAERLMHQFIQEHEREAAGLLPSRRIRDTASADLLTLLEGYMNDMRAQKCDAKHVENTERHIRKLAQSCGWKRVQDVTPESFTNWRARQRESKAPKTLNEYLTSVRAFLNSLVHQNRISDNPLRGVARVKQFQERRVRRAISDQEIASLLSVAPPARRLIYLVAFHTGLRRNEMVKLEWRDIHLDSDAPFIKLRAETTKNRKGDAVYIHPELQQALLEARPSPYSGRQRVLTMFNKLHAFKKDLGAAGIPYVDENGAVFDLHSMRKTLNTRMATANVPTRIAMQAMRHSDERLTTRVYTDKARLPVAEHLFALPHLGKQEVSRIVSQECESRADGLPQNATTHSNSSSSDRPKNQSLGHALTHADTSCGSGMNGSGGRDRTYDLFAHSPRTPMDSG